MDRAAKFIQLYNQLSDTLITMVGGDRSTPFSQLVRQAAGNNTAVRRYQSMLLDFGGLRNAIVHYRAYPEQIIAEPTSEVLNEFEKIAQYIAAPKPLIPKYQTPINVYTLGDPLIKALAEMGRENFSQVVLNDNGRLSLLTVEGIARWLEHKATDDIISIQEATIGDAHRWDPESGFFLMARDKTIFDVQDTFAHAIECGVPRLFAVIITNSGLDTEKPLGIVTPWDLLNSNLS